MNLDGVKPYAKALIGFVTPGVIALVAAVQDGSQGGSNVTGPEWVGIAAACIITGGAVFATPNRDPKGEHQEESVQPAPPVAGDIERAVIMTDKRLPPDQPKPPFHRDDEV